MDEKERRSPIPRRDVLTLIDSARCMEKDKEHIKSI